MTPTIKMPLEQKPDAALMAIGVHGPSAEESFQIAGHWCVHFYTYRASLEVDGNPMQIHPGCVGITPPNSTTVYSFQERSIHACAHFKLRQGDDQAKSLEVPLLQDVGPRFGPLYHSMEEAISMFRTSKLQAEVRLWDILLQLAGAPSASDGPTTHAHHPAVRKAMEIIELRLSETLSVAEIANEVDLSHNQLTRLFNAEQGTTVIGFIQQRRVARAEHLLVHSSLPIKTVAAQVGIEDSRMFNKLMHKMRGQSPMALRRSKS